MAYNTDTELEKKVVEYFRTNKENSGKKIAEAFGLPLSRVNSILNRYFEGKIIIKKK